jgi:hypothetical protein
MTKTEGTGECVVECFWPGVDEPAVRALDVRAADAAAALSRNGTPVRYVGSILMREDEVVLCLFDGTRAAVRSAAVRAEIPFERVLDSVRSPWPSTESGGIE